MADREERRGEGKLHQSAVGDRNALDISTALMFGISKLQHFCSLSWDLGVFITLRVFFAKESGRPWLILFNKANDTFLYKRLVSLFNLQQSKERQKWEKVSLS